LPLGNGESARVARVDFGFVNLSAVVASAAWSDHALEEAHQA
jgi:hypothetical protein